MGIRDIEAVTFEGCDLYVTSICRSFDNRRECESEAVKRLVGKVFGNETQLAHHPSGAPFLPEHDANISISHSRDFACLAVSRIFMPGVDVEQPREQLRRVAPRVLSDSELKFYGSSLEMLLRAWTLKEALFKAAQTEGLDFRTDIHLPLDLADAEAQVRDHYFKILTIDQNPSRTISLVV